MIPFNEPKKILKLLAFLAFAFVVGGFGFIKYMKWEYSKYPIVENKQKIETKESGLIISNKSILDTIINGKSWHEIEIASAPDTALTFYAYRILFTDQKEEIHDCVIRLNLIEETPKVKELMKEIFGHRLVKKNINDLIDSLNLEGIEYARKQVDRDIQKYGRSDGACYELFKLSKRKK